MRVLNVYVIHPGPMIWYQKFEYAIGHWFQKATEHMIGCVLCAPGCFSLFRSAALMDHNVLRKYATKAEKAAEKGIEVGKKGVSEVKKAADEVKETISEKKE